MKYLARLTALIIAVILFIPDELYIYQIAAGDTAAIESLQFREDVSYRVADTVYSIYLFDYLEIIPPEAGWDFSVESSDESVLSASYPYLLVNGDGTTVITVTSNQDPSIQDSREFTVTEPVIPSEIRSLTALQQTAYVNHESSEIAVISYLDGAAIQDTIWTSEDPSIAYISAGSKTKAYITGLQPGTVTISATSTHNPELSVSYEVTVIDELPPADSYHIGIQKTISGSSSLEPLPDPLFMENGEECRLLVKASGTSILPADQAFFSNQFVQSELLEVAGVKFAGFHYARDGSSSRSWYLTVRAAEYGEETVFISDRSFRLIINAPEEKKPEVCRIYGTNRFETNLKTVTELKKTTDTELFDSVILCSGENFADALAGSYLAHIKNAPILITADLVSGVEYYKQINKYIQNNLREGGTVYVLGGTAAVSERAVSDLRNYNIRRLAGKDRFETNIMILEEAGVTNENILVCTGYEFADSLSASAVQHPILLTGRELNSAQRAFLGAHTDSKYYVIGGVKAVNPSIESELTKYGKVRRIAGATRHETSILIAEKFFPEAKSAVLAYSGNFPDGLCGGPLASSFNAPVILTMNGRTEAAVQFCESHGIKEGYVLGGPGLISDYNVRKIFSYSGQLQLR